MYIFGKNNNHLIKNNYKATFSLPQKIRLIQKQIIKCSCGVDFIICLSKDQKPYCYFQSAVYNIEFKEGQKIIDIGTQQNLIIFVTEKGELYATEFMAEKLVSDTLKPKLVRLNLSSKQRTIKQVKMLNGQIFLKTKNNLIFNLKRNDWMETKAFSDPEFVFASQNYNIKDIIQFKGEKYFLTIQGKLLSASRKQLSVNYRQIQIKRKLSKIVSNQTQILGINQEGLIVKVYIDKNRAMIEKIWKVSTRFVDLVIGNENFYGITENQQAWVWGKNANGQLGLSDYQPRSSLYPLVSLEKFYIKNIFIGENYVCLLVDDKKSRDQIKRIPNQSKSPVRDVRSFIGQNHYQECHESFDQTEELLMPIQYTQEESQTLNTNLNESCSSLNVIYNKRSKNEKQNLFKKTIKDQKNPSERQSQKSSLRNKSAVSKVSGKKISQLSCNKSKGKLVVSSSKLTPKSINRQRSLSNNQKQRVNNHHMSEVSDLSKSHTKSQKKQVFSSYKTSNVLSSSVEFNYKKKLDQQYQSRLQRQITEREFRQRQKISLINQTHKVQRERLEEKIHSLEFQFRNKIEENKDLFSLVSQKNRTIEDITSKIRLLQEAIEEHEKALTCRDNEAEEFYLKEKQYQLHIQKLQTQIEKMMEVLNFNERNKETDIYKQQMERLSIEIKERVEDQKQYYREKIRSIERNFDEERNFFQIQIRNLQQEVTSYKQKQFQWIAKLSYQPKKAPIQIITSCIQNNSHCITSPTFHTLDIKNNFKKHVQFSPDLQQSQITLNQEVNEEEKMPLGEFNRQDSYRSPFKQSQNDIKTRKNSKVINIQENSDEKTQENQRSKSQSQVKEILEKIEASKTYISKSANKLLNILENDKA